MHPVTAWFAPSPVNRWGMGGLPSANPDSASAHWNVTVTGVLFQPVSSAAGARVL